MAFYRIILWVVVYVSSTVWGSAVDSTLEICFFSTGQGNCIALRNDTIHRNGIGSKLIFIDCGGGAILQNGCRDILLNQSDYPGKKLKSLFKGISYCEVFITHNHKDHDNLVDTIAEISKREGCSVLDPIRPMSKKTFLIYPETQEGCRRKNKALEIDWINFHSDLLQIEKSLGPYVRVVPIRPKKWEAISSPANEHDFNMMYLVEFAGRRILFPGDINPQLFTRIIEKDPKYRREIAAVDFLVLSHHGSNRSGELMIKSAINPEMCIICSDSNEKDKLPWPDVSDFSLKNNGNVKAGQHVISTANGSREKSIPVFVTCNAAQGYYDLVIEMDGTARLFDGPTDKQRNLFCFQSL